MPYFFSQRNLAEGQIQELSGEEARHILLSHRVKIKEKIKIQGPDHKRFWCEVAVIKKDQLSVIPIEALKAPPEPKISITLFLALCSEKALDFVFQKGTELGLNKIILFNSQNTPAKFSPEQFTKKLERWQRILVEAAKQSERAYWPALEFLSGSREAVQALKVYPEFFLADISGKPLKDLLKKSPENNENLAVLIGPEGGLSQTELKELKSLPNAKVVSLGPILLKVETAALGMLAILRTFFN